MSDWFRNEHAASAFNVRCSGTETSSDNCEEKEGVTRNMLETAEINFDAPATLRKWPSVNHERVSASLGARPYMIIDGTHASGSSCLSPHLNIICMRSTPLRSLI